MHKEQTTDSRPEFSVIIPTRNEEDHIDRLLSSIRRQTIQPKELVLADKSTDLTKQIASKYDPKMVAGVDNHQVGIARNNGAKATTSPLLYFVDADTELANPQFFEKTFAIFRDKNYDIASTYFARDGKSAMSWLYMTITNLMKSVGHILKRPVAEFGASIVITRDAFDRLGGFNETMKVGEDHDFFHRAAKMKMRFGVIPTSIIVSPRRFTKQNIFKAAYLATSATYSATAQAYNVKGTKEHHSKVSKDYWK